MDESMFATKKRDSSDLPLFTNARASDPETSHEAAVRISEKLSTLQQQVLTALALAGDRGATGRELEQLPAFANRGPSTVRKRLTEVSRMGRAEEIGKRDGLTVYRYVAVSR